MLACEVRELVRYSLYSRNTNHSTVAQESTACTPRVGDDIQSGDFLRLEIPKGTPSRVTIDLEWIVGCTVEEECKGGRDDSGLDDDDPRGLVLEGERPARR